MRFPSEDFVISEQQRIIDDVGGIHGIRDLHLLRSALGQPLQSFGEDLYPDIISKAASLGYFLIRNHPFLDGNKRIGHEMMEWILIANEYAMEAPENEQESIILSVASGEMKLEELTEWLRAHSHAVD
jgi:death on curing protein